MKDEQKQNPPPDYRSLLADIKVRVRTAQVRAHLAAAPLLRLQVHIQFAPVSRRQFSQRHADIFHKQQRTSQN